MTRAQTRLYPEPMTAVVVGEHADFEAWLARRAAAGLDGRDEVWKGVYHVAPHEHSRNGRLAGRLIELLVAPARAAGLDLGLSFNLGGPDDYRVPDVGYHRDRREHGVWVPTAALVLEIPSPGDESLDKLPFYAEHGVDEVWLVDPQTHTIDIRVLSASTYALSSRSSILQLGSRELEEQIDWP